MNRYLTILEQIVGIDKIRQNEPMNLHTSMKVGGPAQFYFTIDVLNEFIKIVKAAQTYGIPVTVLGGGTNMIVSDTGCEGLVIKNNCRRFEMFGIRGKVKNQQINVSQSLVYAESGALTNQLVRYVVDQGFSGLEYALGLPGTIGGAIATNANYPPKNIHISDSVFSAKILTQAGEIKEVNKSYFDFSVQGSRLQKTKDILLSVVFQLQSEDKTVLWERAKEASTYRTDTMPKEKAVGYTFRNKEIKIDPFVPAAANIPSVDYLLQKSGLQGKKVGDAELSHSNSHYLLNLGNATADDTTTLLNSIKNEIKNKFHVTLSFSSETTGRSY